MPARSSTCTDRQLDVTSIDTHTLTADHRVNVFIQEMRHSAWPLHPEITSARRPSTSHPVLSQTSTSTSSTSSLLSVVEQRFCFISMSCQRCWRRFSVTSITSASLQLCTTWRHRFQRHLTVTLSSLPSPEVTPARFTSPQRLRHHV